MLVSVGSKIIKRVVITWTLDAVIYKCITRIDHVAKNAWPNGEKYGTNLKMYL